MSLDDRDYMRTDAEQSRRRCSGSFGALRWEIEECPEGDCSMTDTAIAGAVGYGVGLLLGLSPVGRMVSLAAGAIGAQWFSRHHVTVNCEACDVNHDGGPDAPEPEPEPNRPL